MVKKIDALREAYADKNYKVALRIAKNFYRGLTKEQKSIIARAYECIIHPDFYKQIGKNIECEINKGVNLLATLYIKPTISIT